MFYFTFSNTRILYEIPDNAKHSFFNATITRDPILGLTRNATGFTYVRHSILLLLLLYSLGMIHEQQLRLSRFQDRIVFTFFLRFIVCFWLIAKLKCVFHYSSAISLKLYFYNVPKVCRQ